MGDSRTADAARLALSVVLPTQDCFASIHRTVRALAAQTVADRLEIVIVAPSRAGLALDAAALAPFAAHQVVELGVVRSPGQAYTAGIRAAQAPIVALAEDHCFPEPGWAAALLRAHAQDVAAVGPVLRNANPRSAASRADFLIAYARWSDPQPGGPAEFLAGHNSSYKRDRLLAYGDRLEALMEAEVVLHWDLRAAGHRLHVEPAAVTNHLNFSALPVALRVQFHVGRVFAAARLANENWSAARRLLFTAGAPLIPLVRLARIGQTLRGQGRSLIRDLPGLPALVALLLADGWGQLLGYAAGAGRSRARLPDYEFRRTRFLSRQDRAAFTAES